jgi:hypothetical protein
MYDPTVGKWISEDPIEFEGNDPNLGRYVFNSPLTNRDPTGLETLNDDTLIAIGENELIFIVGHHLPIPGGALDDNNLVPPKLVDDGVIKQEVKDLIDKIPLEDRRDSIRGALERFKEKHKELPKGAKLIPVGCFSKSAVDFIQDSFGKDACPPNLKTSRVPITQRNGVIDAADAFALRDKSKPFKVYADPAFIAALDRMLGAGDFAGRRERLQDLRAAIRVRE